MNVYKGFNGDITLHERHLVIERSGLAARVGHGNTAPRTISLYQISACDLRPASRLAQGWIRLQLGGEPPSPLPTIGQATSDSNVILFTYAQRAAFEQLHAWLQHVARTNHERGQFSDAATPAPAVPPLSDVAEHAPAAQSPPASPTPDPVEQSTPHAAPPAIAPDHIGSVTPSSAPPRQTSPPPAARVPLFGARSIARGQATEIARLHSELERLGALDVVQLQQERAALQAEVAHARAEAATENSRLTAELNQLRQTVAVTRDEDVLQEIGIYTFRHPLDDSVAYKTELATLRTQIKAAARNQGGAIEATTNWNVNGSAAEGRKMVRDFSKLMLRAYNAEVDSLVRHMKPYKLASAIDRLEKTANTIERLGKTMSIRVSHPYHRLRVRELELTADYLEMTAREKEEAREERARLREERRVQQDIERERERLRKEQQHYTNALAALQAKGDTESIERIQAQLADVAKAIADVDYRAANVKAGYVYVISNLGAFGERMIKVGMTRRLEPMDRVRELGDASVPFGFDVHALFFSDNAVEIEAQMHKRLADRRVNKVNLRREFFYATPSEAREHLKELTGDLLHFEEEPEAVEFHQSGLPRSSNHLIP